MKWNEPIMSHFTRVTRAVNPPASIHSLHCTNAVTTPQTTINVPITNFALVCSKRENTVTWVIVFNEENGVLNAPQKKCAQIKNILRALHSVVLK